MLLDSLYTLYIPFETWRPKLFATQGHEGGIDYLSNLGYAAMQLHLARICYTLRLLNVLQCK